ncbi:MAG: tetratricopeptide repeat protein [Candidatus Latescibacteria bacterium]|nr:tetratricopeptide repeat protein [bacterium]MBD3423470.1 tetratricopeptide repeat protein [Candidatus Latescibacterota bacterium]
MSGRLRSISLPLLIAALALVATAPPSKATPAAEQEEPLQRKSDVELKVLLAQKLLRDGRTGEALNILQPLYRSENDREMVWQLLVAAYVKSGAPEKGLRLLENRIREKGSTIQLLKALGGVYKEMGDLRQAEETWMRILEDGEEKVRYYNEVADLLWEAGRYQRAIEVLREGAGYDRFHGSYMKKIVRWEMLLNRNRDAFRDELDYLLKKPVKNIRNADRLVQIFAAAGKDTSLISKVDSVSSAHQSGTCVPRLVECVLWAISGDFKRASGIIARTGCAQQSDYISFISLLNMVERREWGSELEQFHAAVIEHFLSQYGDSRMAPRLLLEKASLIFSSAKREGNPAGMDRASGLASQVPEHRFGQPFREKANLLMARIELEGRNNPEEAVRILEGSGWRQRRLKQDGLVLLARAYSLCRECPEAEKRLQKLTENAEVRVASEALYRLAELLMYSGKYQKAAEKFAAAAKKTPEGANSNDALELAIIIKKGLRDNSLRALELIAEAGYLEARGDSARAADSLDLAADSFPESPLAPYAALRSSSLKMAAGRPDEAKKELAGVAEGHPNSIYAPRALERLGDMAAVEDPSEALRLFKTVIDRYPHDPYIDRVRNKYVKLGKELQTE